MSRTRKDRTKFHGYDKESPYAKFLTRRRWRRQGKRLMQDAPPEKGTQGRMTW